jgi:hypothetical protein
VFSVGGQPLVQLHDQTGAPVTIDDLWGLRFGNTGFGGPGSLIFGAGINDENDGLLGLLTPAAQ